MKTQQPTTLYQICNDGKEPKIVPFVVYGHRPDDKVCRGDSGKFLVEDEFCKGQFVWRRPCHSVFLTKAEARNHLVSDAQRIVRNEERDLQDAQKRLQSYKDDLAKAKAKLAAVEKIKVTA